MLDGMFSFVLLDTSVTPSRLIAARDPIGITTLYQGHHSSRPETIFFASELKALQGVPQPQTEGAGDVFGHTLKVLATLARQHPVRTPLLAWGTALHDIGKPAAFARSGGKNFNGHELGGAELAERVATRLKMSRAEAENIGALVADHLKFRDVFQMRESTLRRLTPSRSMGMALRARAEAVELTRLVKK